jgi:hypothetical protein
LLKRDDGKEVMDRVMKITHDVALNFYPIFIPLNQLVGTILDFRF